MIIDRNALRFEARPGRKSADPLSGSRVDFTVRIVSLSSDAVRWAHRHPRSVELLHVTEGHGVLWEDGVEGRFEEGDTALVQAGVPHATLPDPGTEMKLICFFPHPDLDNNIEELEDVIVSANRERNRE